MTVSATTTKAVGEGNGATTEWPFTYRVFQASDVEVILTSAAGVESILASNLYTVVLNSGGVGGKVVYPLAGSPIAAGLKLTSRRKTAQLQNSRLGNQGAFYPKVHEDALDRLTMAVQELQEQADRSVKVDISSGDDPQLLIDQLDADVAEAAAAKVAAELAQSLAETAQAAAELAETNAETAQAAAEASAVAGLASQVAAAASQAAASASEIAAELAETNAETAQAAAEVAQAVAEAAQVAAAASQAAAAASETAASGSATTAGTQAGIATTKADEASASAAAAVVSAAAAAASAAAVNLPSASGHGLDYIRQKVGEDGFEYRTPAQVLSDIGAPTSDDLATVSVKAQTCIDIAVSAYIKADVAGSDAAGAYGRVFSDDFDTDTIGANSTSETYDAAGDYYHNPGGYTADLTTGKTASSVPVAGTPASAIDDNAGTKWSSGVAITLNTDRFIVDFGAGTEQDITKITYKAPASYALTQGTLQWSADGSTWNTSATFAPANSTAVQEFTFAATGTNRRYWSVLASGYAYGGAVYGFQIEELEMMVTQASANMTLVSNAVAMASEPSDVSLYFNVRDVDPVTNGVDRKIYASIDNGATWAESSSYTVVGSWGSDDKLIRADVNVASQAGTSLKWKLETLNAKEQQVNQVTGYAA